MSEKRQIPQGLPRGAGRALAAAGSRAMPAAAAPAAPGPGALPLSGLPLVAAGSLATPAPPAAPAAPGPGALPLSGLPLVHARRTPLRARFLTRPNRFLATVELAGGAQALAHLPNPGRLTGTLSPGCALLLDGPFPARRCAYTVVAAREGRTWVGTVPAFANRLFPALWRGGLFPELAGEALAAEVAHGRSRFDFAVDGAFVEVKSATLGAPPGADAAARVRGAGRDGVERHRLDERLDVVARFPDAVTARGARHCDELGFLARRGLPVAIVFVAQRGDVAAIEPADGIDPTFAAALRRASGRGVRVLGCAVSLGPAGAARAWRVPVELAPAGRG